MTANVAERGLYKTGDGWVQIVAGDQLRRVRAQTYIASGAQPPLESLPLRRSGAEQEPDVPGEGHVERGH